jgi:WD40 repeat protein
MPLVAGTRLGAYEVVGLLGAGGMGEVYRARDTRLGREVALKVLPARFAESPARLARLEREARLLAALNHPHIATLYGFEESGGTPALVMELVEGATLAARLERGPLPLGEGLELARQIAEALEAAHEKGILHRDLKPANVRLTGKGQVKLLDFGLAKALQPVAGDEVPAHPPSTLTTEESPASPGTGVAGTAPYMSPEQARGEEVDRRSDLWAFGCVLYEMLTGRRAFPGRSFAEVVATVLDREPEWGALPAGTPPAVVTLLERCLRKGREERLRDAGDARLELEELLRRGRGRGRREGMERSPYPGLNAFAEEDAAVFFGREREVSELWGKLRRRRLVAVIGPSGAGKTSFLRAGVIPARPEGWGAVCATPGANPALGLARALTPELAGDAKAVGELLSGVAELTQTGETERLVSVARRWRARHAEALLVVDQIEELFTLNPPETQERFAALLGRLASEADIHVVLSLRDDFLMRCHEQEALGPVFSAIAPLGPLTKEGLRRAIVEPASRQGYRFEDEGLVDEMLGAVEGTRGALPLVAFAVSRLWERRDRERKLLTREAYDEIGGVTGALAQHAEATLEGIGPEREGVVREVFRNLVTAHGTRAVMEREELLSAFPERAAVEEVLGRLIDARLLTSYEVEGTERGKHHRVEIVHESLLTNWPRLVRWQAQDEEGALLRDQLKQAAHLWEERGRTSDLLWTGTAYREFELWRERYPGTLTTLEGDFARSMREKARRKKRLVQAAVAVALVGAATVAVVVSVLRQQAVRHAERAEREARLALASKLVALGRNEIERYPAATLAYARKSLDIADNAEARRLAVEALWRSPSVRVLPVEGGTYDVAFSPDGTRLAAHTFADTVLLYPDDGSPPTPIGGFPMPPGGGAYFAFTRKGDALLEWWEGGPLRMVSIPDGREIRRFEPRLPDGRRAESLADWWVTPQGILVGSRDREAPDAIDYWRLEPYGGGPAQWVGALRRAAGILDDVGERWALVRGRSVRVRPVAGDERTPEREVARLGSPKSVRLAFSPDGRRLAVGEPDTGRLALWPVDPSSSRPERVLTLPRPSSRPVFDTTGTRIAWGSQAENAVSLWDLAGPPDAAPRVVRRPDAQGTTGPVFDPHVAWLAVAHQDSVTFWAIGQPWPRILGRLGDLVEGLRFTSDSRRLVSCARDGVSVWPLDPAVAPTRERLASSNCLGLALTPDDRQVLWGGDEVRLASIADGTGMDLVQRPRDESTFGVAIDASGRWGATISSYTSPSVRKKTRIWDLLTGRSVREWAQAPDGEPDAGAAWTALSVAFLADGRLIVGQAGGVRLLDPRTGASEWAWTLPPTDVAGVAVSADGRRAVAVRMPGLISGKFEGRGEILFLDLVTGDRHSIRSHGTRFGIQLALDSGGSVLVSGGPDGAVRVGPSDGREPHLLCCHAGLVGPVAVSPDGEWIASAAGGEIRVWPMPDVTKPPLHALPYDELMAKLGALTNLQVVEDPAAATGYKLDVGPFPGWKDVPTW